MVTGDIETKKITVGVIPAAESIETAARGEIFQIKDDKNALQFYLMARTFPQTEDTHKNYWFHTSTRILTSICSSF